MSSYQISKRHAMHLLVFVLHTTPSDSVYLHGCVFINFVSLWHKFWVKVNLFCPPLSWKHPFTFVTHTCLVLQPLHQLFFLRFLFSKISKTDVSSKLFVANSFKYTCMEHLSLCHQPQPLPDNQTHVSLCAWHL